MEATVYKSTGIWYRVKTTGGIFYNARIKGKFKTENITSTNPIAVGDVVEIVQEEAGEDAVVITKIHDRKNYITRQSPHNKNQHHIIASNIDQCLLVAALKDPRTNTGFIDRFLVAAEAYHVPPVLIFNKSDLYREKEMRKWEEKKEIYQAAGYQVLLISVQLHQHMEALDELLKNKITLISGQSGVGKSSLINTLIPEREIKTREVSGWSGKGMHTTTFAEMYDLPGGGSVIDTPGLKEFAFADMDPVELSHYFAEMKPYIGQCRFNNCLHTDEPECAIKEALSTGKIYPARYISYLDILGSIEEKKW